MPRVDQGYKNLSPMTFSFDEAMSMVSEVFKAYGNSRVIVIGAMSGNMLCELVNLAAHRAIQRDGKK